MHWTSKQSLLKPVCWANAAFATPYLASAFYVAIRSYSDPIFREYQGDPSFALFGFILFYGIFVISLLQLKVWSRWLILLDAIGGYLLIFTFPAAGAYTLGHPGGQVYLVLLNLASEYWYGLAWVAFAGKAAFNTANLLYFFGDSLFELAARYPAAHAVWVVPAVVAIVVPAYWGYMASDYRERTFSEDAQSLAEQEFKKLKCDQIRENSGSESSYSIGQYEVSISYGYAYTGVWVKAQDGKRGTTGGPKYFCDPAYRGPRME